MPTATFATRNSITYFTNRGDSHVLHNQNQAEVTIMWKKHHSQNYLEFELKELHNMTINVKIEPPIGTCSRKQNFPCDDQVCINNIVIESKTS